VRHSMARLKLKVRYTQGADPPKRFKVTTDSNRNGRFRRTYCIGGFPVDEPNKVWTTASQKFRTKASAKLGIMGYLALYNGKRSHPKLGYQTPLQFVRDFIGAA
jgi:hypothetical protein